MIEFRPCTKCGYRHGRGRCCIDVYQQLGRTEGPSVTAKVLLAFGVPLVVFIVSLVTAEYLISGFNQDSNSLYAFAAALIAAVVAVQIIRFFTRKPVEDVNTK